MNLNLNTHIDFDDSLLISTSQEKILELAHINIEFYNANFNEIRVQYIKEDGLRKGFFMDIEDKALNHILKKLPDFVYCKISPDEFFGKHHEIVTNLINKSENIRNIENRFLNYYFYFGDEHKERSEKFKNEINDFIRNL